MIKFDLNDKTRAAGAGYTLMAGTYVVIAFFGGTLLSSVKITGAAYYAVAPIFSAVALFIATLFLAKNYGVGVKKTCGYNKFAPIYLVAALFVAFGMMAGLGFVNDLFAKCLQKIGAKVPETEIVINSVGEYILLILSLSALPAVAEESFFRGALVYGEANCKRIWAAVLAGACFALYHCSLSQLVYQFIYGAALYILAKKSVSVFPGIAAHFLNNFAVLTLGYFGTEVNFYSPVLIACGIASLAAATAFLLLYGRKKNKTETAEKEEEKGNIKEFFLPYGIFGIVIFSALIIGGAVV